MKRNKKKNTKLVLLVLLICITLAYAALRTGLNINGTANISSSSWNVHFENYQNSNNTNITPEAEPTITGTTTTTINYVVNLEQPGDLYEFTVDVVNSGTVDAMIESISSKLNNIEINNNLPNYLDYSITYNDGIGIKNNQLLIHNTTETYKVKVAYKTEINPEQLPSTSEQLSFSLTINYIQDNGNGIPVRAEDADFQTDSWDDIISASKATNPTQLQADMANGTTRDVELDLDQDGTSDATCNLRIANLSTPAECSTEGFSETACGLVVECANVITRHRMNPWTSGITTIGNGNIGGWEKSELRTYLNNDIYNALPSELRNKVIKTKVVSGHGETAGETNSTTTDKIYLLSTKEVYGKDGTASIISTDSAEAETRQLDYYKTKNITTSNYSGTIKKRNNTDYEWWLRSACSNSNYNFFAIGTGGGWFSNRSDVSTGISPAFRIG